MIAFCTRVVSTWFWMVFPIARHSNQHTGVFWNPPRGSGRGRCWGFSVEGHWQGTHSRASEAMREFSHDSDSFIIHCQLVNRAWRAQERGIVMHHLSQELSQSRVWETPFATALSQVRCLLLLAHTYFHSGWTLPNATAPTSLNAWGKCTPRMVGPSQLIVGSSPHRPFCSLGQDLVGWQI